MKQDKDPSQTLKDEGQNKNQESQQNTKCYKDHDQNHDKTKIKSEARPMTKLDWHSDKDQV